MYLSRNAQSISLFTLSGVKNQWDNVHSMPFDTELYEMRDSYVKLLRQLVLLITYLSDGLESFAGLTLQVGVCVCVCE